MSGFRRISGGLYLIAALIAAFALGLGLWDLLVERDGGDDSWLMQVVVPIAIIVLAVLRLRMKPVSRDDE